MSTVQQYYGCSASQYDMHWVYYNRILMPTGVLAYVHVERSGNEYIVT